MQDTPVTIAILSNDKDPDNDKLKIMGVSPPQKGKIETNDDGSIVYSPEKSWAGKEVFSYTVGDGNGRIATATVQVEVQPAINHEPRAIDDTISGNENTPEKIVLKAEDQDDGDKLAFNIVEQPSHGKIANFKSSEGSLVYLPDKDFQGKDGFQFIVTDGKSESQKGQITIEIKPGKEPANGEKPTEQQQQQDQEKQQQQQQEQDKSSKSDEKQGSSNDGSSGDKPASDDSKGDQSTDQKQQDQKEEPKDEQKQEEPKVEEKSSDSGNDSGSSS
jgi:hypothetical protein